MSDFGWFKRPVGPEGGDELIDEIPEVLGFITDNEGRQIPIRRGSLKHEALSLDQMRRVARLRDALIEAYPMTLDGWVDGFLRDAHAENEIQILEAIASVYQRLTAATVLSVAEKTQLYAALCLLSAGGGPDLASSLPARKGLPTLEEIATIYHEARQSGTRP